MFLFEYVGGVKCVCYDYDICYLCVFFCMELVLMEDMVVVVGDECYRGNF